MAQKILLRRGPVGNVPSVTTTKGELLLATGSISDLSGPFIFMDGAGGTGASTVVGKIYEGTTAPSISGNTALTGTPFYATGNQTLYRLNSSGNEALDLSGNLEGTTVSAMTITTLTGTTGNFSGDITGSNLLLSGNANIAGNIVLGGNITVGDADTDFVKFGADVSSSIIPDADLVYTLGTSAKRWEIYGVNSSISGSFSGSFTGILGSTVDLIDIAGAGQGSGTDTLFSGDTLTFTNAADHGFYFTITNNQVSLTAPQSLKTTASPTFAGATAGNIQVGVTGDNEIDTTSGNLTIDSAGGTVTVDDNLTVTGATITLSSAPAGTDNTVLVLNASNQVVTDEIDARVWGTSLVDGTGTANQVTFWSDSNTVTGDAGMTYNSTTDVLTVGTSTFGLDVNIAGNLTVQGTTTTIDSTTVNIGDNIIVLNGAGAVDGGMQVIDVTGTTGTGSLLWNATSDYWYAGVSGSTHYRLATFNSATPTTNNIQKVDSNKRLVDSILSDDGTTLTVSGNITGNTITANTAIVAAGLTGVIDTSSRVIFRDGSNRLGALAVTDSAVEMSTVVGYKADGTLVASSLIDGGTF